MEFLASSSLVFRRISFFAQLADLSLYVQPLNRLVGVQ